MARGGKNPPEPARGADDTGDCTDSFGGDHAGDEGEHRTARDVDAHDGVCVLVIASREYPQIAADVERALVPGSRP